MESKTQKIGRLRSFNLFMGGLHFAQALFILFLARNTEAPRTVTSSYLAPAEGSVGNEVNLEVFTRDLFTVNFVWFSVGFLLLSATFHLLISTVYYKKYSSDLQKGMNRMRWFEYSLSASWMMVAIMMLAGNFDFGVLLSIFVLTAIMNLMGYIMEVHNQTTKETNWSSYWIGVLAAVVPWIVIGLQLWSSETSSNGDVPTFVYGIFFSIFLFFNCFAINMVLQYKEVGKWSDYLYGERVYIILSLVAKSALAWQIYAGTLQPA